MSTGFVSYASGSIATFQGVTGSTAGFQSITGSITKTVTGLSYLVGGPNVTITSGTSTDQVVITVSAVGGQGDPNPSYLVLASTASLTNERVLTVSGTSGLFLTDSGPNSNASLAIDNSIVATVSGTRFTGAVTGSSGILASGLTSSLGLAVTAGGVTVSNSTNAAATLNLPVTATLGIRVTGTTHPGVQSPRLSGSLTQTFNASSSFINRNGIIITSGAFGGVGSDEQVAFGINDVFVATVSGTRFTGPVTASSGLLVSTPQGITGSITVNAGGTSYIASTGQLITVSSASTSQITLDINVPAGRIVGTPTTGTLPGPLNFAEVWSVIDTTQSLGYQVINYTTPRGAPLTNTNFDSALRAACKAAVTGGGGTVVIPPGDWTVSSDAELDPLRWQNASFGGSVIVKGAGQMNTRLNVPTGYTGSVLSFKPHVLGSFQTGGGVEDLMIQSPAGDAKGSGIRIEGTNQFNIKNVWVRNFSGVGGRGIYNFGEGTNPLLIGLHLDNVMVTAWTGVDLNNINSSYAYDLRFENCVHRSAVFSGGCGLKVFGCITEAISEASASGAHIEFIPGVGGQLGTGGSFNSVWKGGYAEQAGNFTGSIFRCNGAVSSSIPQNSFGGLIEIADFQTFIASPIAFCSASYASVILKNIFTAGYPIGRLDNCSYVETHAIGEGVDDGLIMDATSRRNYVKIHAGIVAPGTLLTAPVISSSLGFRLPFYSPGSYPSASTTPSGTLIANRFTNEIFYKRDSSIDTWAPIAERPFDIDLDLGPFLGEYWDISRSDLVQTTTTYSPGVGTSITFVTGAFSGTVLTASATRPTLEIDANLGGNKVVKFNKTGSTALTFSGNSPFIASDTTGPWVVGVLSHDEEAVNSDGQWCVVSGTNDQSLIGYLTLNAAALDQASWITLTPSLIFDTLNNITGSTGFVSEAGFGALSASPQSATTWFNGEQSTAGYNPTNTNGVQKIWLGSNSAAAQFSTIRLAFFMILKKYPGDALIWKLRQYLVERFNLPQVKHQALAVKSPYLHTFKTTGAPADILNVYDFVETAMNGQKVYIPVFK